MRSGPENISSLDEYMKIYLTAYLNKDKAFYTTHRSSVMSTREALNPNSISPQKPCFAKKSVITPKSLLHSTILESAHASQGSI